MSNLDDKPPAPPIFDSIETGMGEMGTLEKVLFGLFFGFLLLVCVLIAIGSR